MNPYDIRPTGEPHAFISSSKLIDFLKTRYRKKEEVHKQRKYIRDLTKEVFEKMQPTTARSKQKNSDLVLYTSGLGQIVLSEGLNLRLNPDFMDFEPQGGLDSEKASVQASNASDIHQLARNKGNYRNTTERLKSDLVMGEQWIYREYKKNKEGENVKMWWRDDIRWENVLGFYGDTDVFLRFEMSPNKFVEVFDLETLKKVTFGGILGGEKEQGHKTYEELSAEEWDKDCITAYYYWDYALKRHYCVLGGNGYVYEHQEDEEYTWVMEGGLGFAPLYSRVWSRSLDGRFGVGILELVAPLMILESTLVNASAHAEVLASSPLWAIYGEEVEQLQDLWQQYVTNRKAGQHVQPFFMKQSLSSQMRSETFDFQPTNNIESWRSFLTEQVIQRTRIDIRSLSDYAPTADQQRLRKQEQDKVNRMVIARNAEADAKAALEDLYMLRSNNSLFHDVKVLAKVPESSLSTELLAISDELRDDQGQLPRKEMTIREVLASLGELDFQIRPRLEGALSDQDFIELENARRDMSALPQNTRALTKMNQWYYKKAYPGIGFQDEDFEVQPVTPNQAQV